GANEVGGHVRQLFVTAVGPTVFDRNVLALHEAHFAQALADRSDARGVSVRGGAAEKPNQRLPCFLRPCGKRPPGGRTEYGLYEISPAHASHAPNSCGRAVPASLAQFDAAV